MVRGPTRPAQCQRDQPAGDGDPLKVGHGIETKSSSRENEGSGGEERKSSGGGGVICHYAGVATMKKGCHLLKDSQVRGAPGVHLAEVQPLPTQFQHKESWRHQDSS